MQTRIFALGVLAATSAWADAPTPVASAPSVPRATADWSGPYGGLTVGAIFSPGEADRAGFEGALIELDVENGLFPDEIDNTEGAAIGGLTFGANRQRGAFVGGLEFDISATDLDSVHDFSRIDPNPDPMFFGVETITGYETRIDGFATARLRGGYARDRNLLYVTGGLAAADVENRFTLDLPELGFTSPDWSEDDLRFGFVVGAGIERQVGARTRLKAELLHYDLEDVTVEARDPVTFPGQAIDYEFQNSGFLARIGVNFAF